MNKVNRIEIVMRISAAILLYIGTLAMPQMSVSAGELNDTADEPTFATNANGCLAPLDTSLRALHSNSEHDLCALSKGKVVMVVNTASQCGYTGQFEDLEAIYREYQEQGLVILGFPSDSFRQEYADEEATAEVCFRNFGVTFPMMATTKVTGDEANSVFQALTNATQQAPRWNFHKYVISADGSRVRSFASAVKPTDESITQTIESFLQQ